MLVRFILAVLKHWVIFAAGGALAVALEILRRFVLKVEIPNRIYLLILIACLFFAFYGAWLESQKQYRAEAGRVTGLQTQIDLLAKPDLRCVINSVQFSPGGRNDSGTIVLAHASLVNRGADSIAEDWSMALRFADGATSVGEPIILNQGDVFAEFEGGGKYKLRGGNLEISTTDNAIRRGGPQINGSLIRFFDGIKKQDIETRRPVIVVTFADFVGRSHEVVFHGPPDGRMIRKMGPTLDDLQKP